MEPISSGTQQLTERRQAPFLAQPRRQIHRFRGCVPQRDRANPRRLALFPGANGPRWRLDQRRPTAEDQQRQTMSLTLRSWSVRDRPASGEAGAARGSRARWERAYALNSDSALAESLFGPRSPDTRCGVLVSIVETMPPRPNVSAAPVSLFPQMGYVEYLLQWPKLARPSSDLF